MKSKRKIILSIFIAIDLIVLFLLILIYFWNDEIGVVKINGVPTELLQTDTIRQTANNIQITINPTPISLYLSNPGIGWQDEINNSSGYLPETVAYSERNDISWDILNPAEGVYNWEALESQLLLAKNMGRLYSFRVYTMAGEDFGGHKIPSWVLKKGARLMPSGEPDYSNCIYQEEWGNFVDELITRYDGNSDIAFIDISGYGDFSEWSWRDEQTVWDELWEKHYAEGTADSSTIQTIDGQARRRIADMFIGGTFDEHICLDENGMIQTTGYSYKGFTSTQLVMPFAGIVQSTQYVFSRRPDVGFRYDSLGRLNSTSIYGVSEELSQIWQRAPVVFELSKPEEFDVETASHLLQSSHASLVHNNNYSKDKNTLQELLINVGYRYYLRQVQFNIHTEPGGKIDLVMLWQNVGLAPNYPQMGQSFQLQLNLVDQRGNAVMDYVIPADISSWMPAATKDVSSPEYMITHAVYIPEDISPGVYSLMVTILDLRSDRPINLAFSGRNEFGQYRLADFVIDEK